MIKRMQLLILLAAVLFLTSCQGSGAAILQAVALEPCEIGEVELSGNFDVSSNPLVTANVFVNMREVHTAETIPKDCPGSRETVPDPPPAS